ncbi:CU044_2847 family protein [Actinokineospora sp. NPDC004072]
MTDSELVRFPLADGGSILVEVREPAGVARAGRAGRVLGEARATFEQAVAGVRDAAAAALSQFAEMTRAPDEVELKFGVKLDAEVGAVIARTGVQGQLEVKLRWRRDGLAAAEETVEEP